MSIRSGSDSIRDDGSQSSPSEPQDRIMQATAKLGAYKFQLERTKFTAALHGVASLPPDHTWNLHFDPEQHKKLIDINQVWIPNGNDVLQSMIIYCTLQHVGVVGGRLSCGTKESLSTCHGLSY